MMHFFGISRISAIFIFLLFVSTNQIISQPQSYSLKGKKIGLYISSIDVTFTDHYYFPISQFLTVGENRLGAEKMKTEFLIRLGEMLIDQITDLSEADTVYFVNANIDISKSIRNSYDKNKSALVTASSFFDMDYLMIMDQLNLSAYKGRSVFIRSNRMYSEQIDFKTANMKISVFQQPNISAKQTFYTCLDDKKSFDEKLYFDFHNENSSMGKFLGKLFSHWWVQLIIDNSSNCDAQ